MLSGLDILKTRVGYYGANGSADQWTRMREDKLRSLKKALKYSYQSAVVQKYNVKKDALVNNIIAIITSFNDDIELTETQLALLETLEAEYDFLDSAQRGTTEYIEDLEEIISDSQDEYYFRCLINHDKLKVDYQDKVISIPFEENTVTIDPVKDNNDLVETGFKNGTVFKWIHGNKQEWVPDTYWIVYMQYSEETAYFRGEIRKADQEIQIVVINPDGSQETLKYRGWMTGPNETTALWHTKKNITWNDLNYTKLLYITKDEDTLAFFQRFDRLIINGKPWQVQAYNENYGNSSGQESGIIRVALKETYTSTDEFIKNQEDAAAQAEAAQIQNDTINTSARIDGPEQVYPFETITYKAKNFEQVAEWSVSDSTLVKIKNISQDGLSIIIDVITTKSNKAGFNINYGETTKHIVVGSL